MTDQPGPVFSARMVRELKGAPLSVLILLGLADQPVDNRWLIAMSGYSDKPISAALTLLSSPEYQMAVRTFHGWRLADGINLALISRRNSVPTTTINDVNNINLTPVVVESENFRIMRNLEACREMGIGEPSASQIAVMEHVTPEYIRGHVEGLGPRERKGMAINRIKGGEPVPSDPEPVEPKSWSLDSWMPTPVEDALCNE